jgi:hypothetical protein
LQQEQPQKQPRLPELEVSRAARVLKGRFSIVHDPVPEAPFYMRFKSLITGEEIQGYTHAKGTKISPIFLIQILDRFDITRSQFLEALSDDSHGPQIVK